jgi:hypothetical protein
MGDGFRCVVVGCRAIFIHFGSLTSDRALMERDGTFRGEAPVWSEGCTPRVPLIRIELALIKHCTGMRNPNLSEEGEQAVGAVVVKAGYH